jgi:hypothetical protein
VFFVTCCRSENTRCFIVCCSREMLLVVYGLEGCWCISDKLNVYILLPEFLLLVVRRTLLAVAFFAP